MTDPNKIFLKSTLSPPPPWSQASLLLATHQSAQWPPASPIPACPPSVDPSSSCPPPPVRPGVAAAAPGFLPSTILHPRSRGSSRERAVTGNLMPYTDAAVAESMAAMQLERCQTISWAKVSPGDWGQWWTPCDESEPIAATTKLSCRKVSAGSAKKSENFVSTWKALQLRNRLCQELAGAKSGDNNMLKYHENSWKYVWILDIDESDSTAIFGAKWPNPPLASQVSLGFFFRQIPGKPPKTVGFPGRPSAAIFRFKTSPRVGYGFEKAMFMKSFHDLQKLWQAIKSIEAAAS